jgi:Mor family transcriptional regulator
LSFLNDLRRMGATDDLLEKLCWEYGGERVYVGKLTRFKKHLRDKWIRDQYDKGATTKILAARLNLSMRRVREIRNGTLYLFEEYEQ